MFLIKADAMAEAAQAEIPTEIFEAMTKFNEHMAAEGILPAAEGFRPTAVDGYRVQGGSCLRLLAPSNQRCRRSPGVGQEGPLSPGRTCGTPGRGLR